MEASAGGRPELIPVLVELGADVNAVDLRGNPALLNIGCVLPAMVETAEALLRAGADATVRNLVCDDACPVRARVCVCVLKNAGRNRRGRMC